jgi:hypothetical protein
MKDNDFIDTIQKFWLKVLLEFIFYCWLYTRIFCIFLFRIILDGESNLRFLTIEPFTSDIRRHDDDGVFEVYFSTFRVRQMSIIHNLEKDIEHVSMGFLDLIEQDHRVWFSSHGFRELSALIESDVSWRRTDESRHRMRFHVLAHIESDKSIFVIEKLICERFCRLCLPDSSRPEKKETSDRATLI